MKKKKSEKPDPKWGAYLTPQERDRIWRNWLDRTKPEDMFPEGYRIAMQRLEKMAKAGLLS